MLKKLKAVMKDMQTMHSLNIQLNILCGTCTNIQILVITHLLSPHSLDSKIPTIKTNTNIPIPKEEEQDFDKVFELIMPIWYIIFLGGSEIS